LDLFLVCNYLLLTCRWGSILYPHENIVESIRAPYVEVSPEFIFFDLVRSVDENLV
jgi:hypothetical protein